MDEDDNWRPRCPPAKGLVRPVPIDPVGTNGPTRHQARRGRWRRSSYGFYVPVDAGPEVVEQRILEQSMRVGDGGAVTGWAALRMWGAAFFDGLAADGRTSLPVPLVSPKQLAGCAGSVSVRASLAGHGIWLVQGAPCVSVERAVVDEILRGRSLRSAVVVIDMACAARITSINRIRVYVDDFPRRGMQVVRDALALATERSRSPKETEMRLVWILDAGWPTPVCNAEVFDLDGRLLGIPDVLDPRTGTFGEYDGAHHRTRARHRRDVSRMELLRAHGLEGFVMVAGDTPEVQIQRMEAAARRAAARPPDERRWRLTLPDGSTPPDITADRELDAIDWPRDHRGV